MISFENTEVAFKSKSNRDLNRAYWLFKVVASPALVKFGKWFTNFAFKIHLPISGIVKKTIFKQFCGGETISECQTTTDNLSKFGIGTILDYSVEGKTNEEDFEHTVQEIIATIHAGQKNPNIPFAVFKITGISPFHILEKANNGLENLNDQEKKSYEAILDRVTRICEQAHDCQVPLFIDAEESWIQDTIDTIVRSMMQKFNREKAIIFNTAQMYRHDRLHFLQQELTLAREGKYHVGIKLVRGAYMEKERDRAVEKGYPSPIQPDKAATDRDFDAAIELLIQHIDIVSLCAGTHNETSSQRLAELLKKSAVDIHDRRVYFAQLLGMSDHISYNLSHEGYNVAKYVPYGPVKEVMPYLLRRADENTSVAGQTGRELGLIIKEKNRRKLAAK